MGGALVLPCATAVLHPNVSQLPDLHKVGIYTSRVLLDYHFAASLMLTRSPAEAAVGKLGGHGWKIQNKIDYGVVSGTPAHDCNACKQTLCPRLHKL